MLPSRLGIHSAGSLLAKPRSSIVSELACTYCRPAPYQHFKGRQPWWQSQSTVRIMLVVGGAGGVYYVAHIETVPYTHRRHAVLVSPATERSLGAQTFKQVCPELFEMQGW